MVQMKVFLRTQWTPVAGPCGNSRVWPPVLALLCWGVTSPHSVMGLNHSSASCWKSADCLDCGSVFNHFFRRSTVNCAILLQLNWSFADVPVCTSSPYVRYLIKCFLLCSFIAVTVKPQRSWIGYFGGHPVVCVQLLVHLYSRTGAMVYLYVCTGATDWHKLGRAVRNTKLTNVVCRLG